MAVVEIEAVPFKMVKPSLLIGPVLGTQYQLNCASRQIEHVIDEEEIDDSTFCAPSAVAPGKITESLEVTGLVSFGDIGGAEAVQGLFNALYPLAGTVQDFDLLANGDVAVGTANPRMTGTCYIPRIPMLLGSVGENSEINLSFKIRTGGSSAIVFA